MKIIAKGNEMIISRNVHFLVICENAEDFLKGYQMEITNNTLKNKLVKIFNEDFENPEIIEQWSDFVSRLNKIMVDEKGHTIKTRKQIKLDAKDSRLIYKVFSFVSSLDSNMFKGTELEYQFHFFEEMYRYNNFYNVVGMVDEFIELYDVANSKHMPVQHSDETYA
jgi:hypothetical protein